MKQKIVCISVYLVIVLIYSGYAQQPSISVQQHLTLSNQAYRAGDYEKFLQHMKKAAELEPHRYQYRYNLACGYALNNDHQNAVNTLQFLLDQDYDLVFMAAGDADFSSLKDNKEFQKIVKRIEEKTRPLNTSSIAFSILEKDLIPEGMAYDPVEKAFYMGSIQKCKIIKIDKDGNVSDFTDPRQDGLVSLLGMRVDAERRVLWAASSYSFYKKSIPRELLGTAGIFKYDLRTKKLLKKYMLPQEEGHYLNDLTVSPDGSVYITDWLVHGIYKISAKTDTIEKLIDMPRQPNGIDISDDGTKLFIAGNGMGVLDMASKSYKELKYPPNMYVSGDGCYFYKNSLIAVQNGGFRKVSRFYLNDAQDEIVRSEPLEAYHPLFNIPTTGALAGNDFYFIANSQLRAFNRDGSLFPLSELEEVKILKIGLK